MKNTTLELVKVLNMWKSYKLYGFFQPFYQNLQSENDHRIINIWSISSKITSSHVCDFLSCWGLGQLLVLLLFIAEFPNTRQFLQRYARHAIVILKRDFKFVDFHLAS